MENKFKEIEKLVEKELKPVGVDHNIDHVRRVYALCLKIARSEKGVDLVVLRPAALLHDIGYQRDHRVGTDIHDIISAEMSEKILSDLEFTKDQIDKIKDCILSHRFRTDHKPKTIEAKILFDADKLEAVGAIGLIRGAIWLPKMGGNPFSIDDPKNYAEINHAGGKENGKILDWAKHNFFKEYRSKSRTLPKKLYTKKGRELARARTIFEKQFLTELKGEIEGRR